MKIGNIWINGIEEPMGFYYHPLIVSWCMEGGIGESQKEVTIDVSIDPTFENVLYTKTGNLTSSGVELPLMLLSRTKYYVKIQVVTNAGCIIEKISTFETGKMDEKWRATWIGYEGDQSYHPIFTKVFQAKQKVVSARLYICGLGLYEVYINQDKVGKEVLTPFVNDYDSFIQVQTYDVTHMLQKQNEILVLLGNGWYKGRFGLEGKSEIFGKRYALLTELVIMYEDGSGETVCSDTSWKCMTSSIIQSGIYDGEYIDKTKPIQALTVERVSLDALSTMDRISPRLEVIEEMPVQSILRTPKNEVVLDFGQNFAGWITFQNRFENNHKITFEFGEILQGDCFYNGNYNTATNGFTYISNGTKEIVRPHFTYFGFRYVRVTGFDDIKIEDVKGLVIHSNLQRVGFIETGHPKINKLYENVLWGIKSNFLDLPTDCPQRDERLGWTGDAQVFAPTACYYYDTRSFYRKYLYDLRCEQIKLKGSIPNYIPAMGSSGGSSVWGDVATFIPYEILKKYGCIEEIAQYYPLMKDWVDRIGKDIEEAHGDKSELNDCHFEFGDWLALDGALPSSFEGGSDTVFIASTYYCQSLKIVSEVARILNYNQDALAYSALHEKAKNRILDEFYTPRGRLSVDTQTGYILALQFKVYRNKDIIIKQLQRRLEKDLYKIKSGFVGTPLFCQTLVENGMSKVAYEILLQEDFPGWLYAINLGATTIWERWNSVFPDGTINPAGMNSLNHYSYGAISEFLYKHVAGIQTKQYGFQDIVLAPIPNSSLRYVHASYCSLAGNIVSSWQILENGKLHCHFELPFNTKATILLPYSNQEPIQVTSGIYDYTYRPTIDLLHPYTIDTRISILKKDKQAFAQLLQIDTSLQQFINRANEEQLEYSILQASELFYTGVSKEAVEKVREFLSKISIFDKKNNDYHHIEEEK